LSERLQGRAVDAPKVRSFYEFLTKYARVKVPSGPDAGLYRPYSFEGREALEEPVRVLDEILGSETGTPLKDATWVLAGGAQFGKTVLELNLAAYVTSQLWLNAGVYLPDDELAASIVDVKFRPDVLDQVEWLAQMTQVGRLVNKSGKAVNTKGAFLVTDGQRKASGMFRGLKKVPTTFSQDVVIRDEEDDIPRDKAKFLSGRLTASALRLQIIVGTQRIHGSGQHKQWKNGSQGVRMLGPKEFPTNTGKRDEPNEHGHQRKETAHELANTGKLPNENKKAASSLAPAGHETPVPFNWICPEEHWPQVCRCAVTGSPRADDPVLTYEGDFKRAGSTEVVATYEPDGHYYLAHPTTGEPLDLARVRWAHRRPERIKLRRWSFRVSQIGTGAIDLGQIVAHWERAVGDAEEMNSFCCDRLAIPKSAAQSLTPSILERSRTIEAFDFRVPVPGRGVFAGLDTGDRCWFVAREVEPPFKRIIRADVIAAGDAVNRATQLCEALGVSVLFIDERPLVYEARTIAMRLNKLEGIEFPRITDWNSYVSLPSGLSWDGRVKRWSNLRCALVRFSKRQPGQGIEQSVFEFEEAGQKKFVPLIECNRMETIDRVVREFLTPKENVIEVVKVNGVNRVRETPSMLLPRRLPGAPAILETLDNHLLTGSQREKDPKTGELGDYVDKCDNHLLLANAYSGLAENQGAMPSFTGGAFHAARNGTKAGRALAHRRERACAG
jgi:hypothetical protein